MCEREAEIGVDVFAGRGNGAQLVSTAFPEEYASEHVPGAENVPLEDVLASPQRFAGKESSVICRSRDCSLKATDAMQEDNVIGGGA